MLVRGDEGFEVENRVKDAPPQTDAGNRAAGERHGPQEALADGEGRSRFLERQ